GRRASMERGSGGPLPGRKPAKRAVRAALAALKRSGAARIILLVPVISPDTAAAFRREGFEVVAVIEPADFGAVGQFYQDFHQLSDNEVVGLLRLASAVEATP